MICPCHCGQPVKPGNRYAGPGCYMRTPQGRAHARKIGKANAREGGVANQTLWRHQVLDRFRHLDRDAAILAAVEWSRLVTVRRHWRAKQRRAA